jgi:hypothetical protein
MDYLFLTYQPGLLMFDIPAHSIFLEWVIQFWMYMLVINLILGVIKRIPVM